jgi:hypothetical protein
MSSQRIGLIVLAAGALGLLSSCLGLDAELTVRADGSGTVTLDYRLSKMVESMGKLDGNERWLPFPIGRADFERSVEQVPGLTLSSFSQTSDETDVRIKASLAFADSAALLGFMDHTGRAAGLTVKDKTTTLSLQLSEGGALDADLEALVRAVFEGYEVKLRINTPTPGEASGPGASSADRTAAFQAPVADILAAKAPFVWQLKWKQ